LLAELKRRNVIRVGIAYVVAAWLIIQVVETILPAFGFGDAAVRIVTILLAIGLIPALIISWAFELTPEGLKKDVDVDHSGSPSLKSGKILDRMIMGGLVLALVYFAFDKFVLDPSRDAQIAQSATEAGAEGALERLRQGMWNEKSIAVLPFANRSELKQDEYFTDGMHDELLTRLSRIKALKVISRTSVMRYRDTEKSLPEIARELSVATILEGGVQRAGEQVRINVQLINAHTDEHLWAEIFDRELTAENLFAIQSEISKAIADALEAEITPQTLASIEVIPTSNAEAYDLYLRAIDERKIFRGAETFLAMKPLLERAVALDPDFLLAQVLLVETYGRLGWTGADENRTYGPKSLELVSEIRRRWPDHLEGHFALGHYYYTVERDYARALEEYRIVEEVYPNDADLILNLASSLKRLGRAEEQLEYARRLVQLDPENSLAAQDHMVALRFNGLAAETIAAAEEGLRKFPEDPNWSQDLARYRLMFLGDVEGYLAFGNQLREAGNQAAGGRILTWLLFRNGEVDRALEQAALLIGSEYDWNGVLSELDIALILRAEGRDGEAQAAADHAYGFVKEWLDAGRHFPTIQARYWFTLAAYSAAVAGDFETARKHRDSAMAAPEDELLIERLSWEMDALTRSLMGDAEAGWSDLATHIETHYNYMLTPDFMAAMPYYSQLFGAVPEFQAFIAKARHVGGDDQPGLVTADSLEHQTGVVTAPDDVPIHYSTYGTGKTALVFVHGISCDQTYWKEQVIPFSGNFHVVTIDLAGHGKSGMERMDWSMDAYGGDVSAVVEALNLENVVLIGHSMGGAVIFRAARQLPGRIKGIVAVDTFEDFRTWYTAKENEEFVQPFREDYLKAARPWIQSMFMEGTDPAWVEQVLMDMSASPPEVMIPSFESAIEVICRKWKYDC
jgi:TolB-like protein